MRDVPAPNTSEIESILNDTVPELDPEIAGPIHVDSAAIVDDGLIACEASATRLVSMSESSQLGDIAVPLPIRLSVRLTTEGQIVELTADQPDADAQRQAQAHADMLVARGAVRGVAREGAWRGAPPRPTHEVTTDRFGRRVLTRVGFESGGAGVADKDKNL